MPQHVSRVRAAVPVVLTAAVAVGLLLGEPRPAHAYIDIPPQSLAQLCKEADAVAVLRVAKVNREKRGIVYSKVRDLKGSFPTQGKYFGDTFTHIIRKTPYGFSPSDPTTLDQLDLQEEAILASVTEGRNAVIFQRRGEHAICVGHSWYHARPAMVIGSERGGAPPAKEPWVYGGPADPRLARFFCGNVEELVAAVPDLLAGKEATVPRMVGTEKMVGDRSGPIQRARADRIVFPDRSQWDHLPGTSHTGAPSNYQPKKEFDNPFWDQAPWCTHRGNPQRTGADDKPGPAKPSVLWAYKSPDHFIAPLVPGAKDVYASSLGAFNTPGFHALALDPAGDKQLRWSRGAPLLRQPIAGAPAIVRPHPAMQVLVFGDGFHTDEGASLRCVRASDGFPLWQLPVPGKLVHFEGTPTFSSGGHPDAHNRLFVGGGNAGVLCLEPSTVILDGKEYNDPLHAQGLLEHRWKELLAAYEAEKKKDPRFALPPDESMLPRPTPKRAWQQGQDKWHVDAPVALVEDRILAASAHLDDEKTGERALICLRAKDGEVTWKVPLKLNPWAGPTVGPYVLVGCSSIRLDPQAVSGATGEVVAVELDTGKVRWRRDVPGGVLSAVAVKEGLAVFTATDGKVRAWDAFTGTEKWVYDATTPFFAGVAVAGRTVYAADLKGVIHAINLADGKRQWTLDLAADPATRTTGMVYGSPVVHGGRLYLATCSLEGGAGGATNVVVCIGDK
jgi:outer membrane protein assembly factor BamB